MFNKTFSAHNPLPLPIPTSPDLSFANCDLFAKVKRGCTNEIASFEVGPNMAKR
jgi:hypothetical protein